MTHVSFEFFPVASDEARRRLMSCAEDLATFGPAFMSVTYGAGGSNRDRTLACVADLAGTLPTPVAGHLTTVASSAATVHQVIDSYRELGVNHIVALRGDPPDDASNGTGNGNGTTAGPAPAGYETAADLVAAIRSRPDGDRLEISVAAYPEVHPKARSAKADLDNLKRKVDAGADRAITQFFFDPDVFLRFRDRAVAAGIDVPIVAGIMPVSNVAGIKRFAERCGAAVPAWVASVLDGLDDDPEVRQLVAATIAAEQCQRLAAHGVDAFHFYTMNRRNLTAAVCRRLGLGLGEREPLAAGAGSR